MRSSRCLVCLSGRDRSMPALFDISFIYFVCLFNQSNRVN